MSILEDIRKGEGKTIEFKEIMPSADKLAKTVIAFANMAGGKIIIGVSDRGEIKGIEDLDITQKMDKISNILHDMVQPIIIPDIYTYAIEDTNVLVVEVYPSQIKPHFIKRIGKLDGTYIRVGATNKRADIEYIQELERQRINLSFDEDYWIEQSPGFDINRLLDTLKQHLVEEIKQKDLENLKLIKKQDNITHFTNSVPILLGVFDYVQIKCARFKGNEMDVFIDRKEFNGNLFEQLENTMNFLLSHINLHGKVGSDFITRVDEYEIPPEALREAIVNAIIHRDYSMTGSDIKVSIFDSRIEIISPGGFPKGITVEEVVGGRSEIRNRVIVRIFKEAKKIEQWGRGVKRTMQLCINKGLKKPEIYEVGMFVKFVFYRESDAKSDAKSGAKSDAKSDAKYNISNYQDILIKYLNENSEINISKAVEILGLSKSRTNDILKIMVDDGIITRKGRSRATKYIIKG